MAKDKLLDQIGELSLLSNALAEKCKAYCADESISVADRWEVFRVAPGKDEGGWVDEPPEDIIGFECVTYEHLYLERYATFDVVSSLDDWARDVASGNPAYSFSAKLTPAVVDQLKNYYMTQYKGSWINDW